MQHPVNTFNIHRFHINQWEAAEDLLAAEEPMEIRLEYGPEKDRSTSNISVTMRTPGNDFELALGFLYTEGIIHQKSDVIGIRYCIDHGNSGSENNIVRIALSPGIDPDMLRLQRNFYTTSSCGVCGKTSIDAVLTQCKPSAETDDWKITEEMLLSLPVRLREKQLVFEHTGGLHASALFGIDGTLLYVREDVGRHNALDKLIGAGFSKQELPFNKHLLLLSGRASFELIQKAAMAGIRFVAAVGAPSGLAVTLARSFDITLIGFLREARFNCYSAEKRIIS